MSGRIFISYRRQDSAGYAGRLYDRLSNRFGQDNIFMDIDTIELGVDFVQKIQEAVGACDVLLAVIGPAWLTIAHANGKPRLNESNDYVRIEIQTALQRNIRVIPILVQGAHMPQESDLPRELAPLARRNGMEIEHASFDSDANLLITKLEKMLDIQAQAQGASPGDDNVDFYPDSPNPAVQPQGLPAILPGTWQVNVNMPTPYGMVPMQMNVEIYANGTFQGVAPVFTVQGQWSMSAIQQVVFAGQQSNGLQVVPYNVVIQFTQISQNQLSGYTSGNETTAWIRIA